MRRQRRSGDGSVGDRGCVGMRCVVGVDAGGGFVRSLEGAVAVRGFLSAAGAYILVAIAWIVGLVSLGVRALGLLWRKMFGH